MDKLRKVMMPEILKLSHLLFVFDYDFPPYNQILKKLFTPDKVVIDNLQSNAKDCFLY